MIEAMKSAWALFLGLAFIMVGNGLQGSLVAMRAQFEVFNTSVIGFVMAGYFVGFFLGSLLVPPLVARVGHVRVFGALASLASLGVLVYPIIVDPVAWFLIRVLTGLCYAGLYIICESWLNDRATNETRGQLLSIYMIISLLGLAGGQFLLNLYSPADFQLFTIVSVLISLSVVPVLVSAARVPEFEAPETMGPIRLYRASPLGVVSMFLVGTGAGVIIGMGPSYAYQQGLTVAEISIFMSSIFVGGFLFTWPIGKMSDIMDRRTVIVITAGAAVAIGAVGAWLGSENKLMVYVIVGITGGVTFPIYSLAIAHTNDFLNPKQMVAASSALVMTNGLGAMLGPNIGAGAMEVFGPDGFYISIAAIHVVMVAFALWRMTRRPAPPPSAQGAFVAVPRTTSMAAAMSPEYEHPEDEASADAADLEATDDLPNDPVGSDTTNEASTGDKP